MQIVREVVFEYSLNGRHGCYKYSQMCLNLFGRFFLVNTKGECGTLFLKVDIKCKSCIKAIFSLFFKCYMGWKNRLWNTISKY